MTQSVQIKISRPNDDPKFINWDGSRPLLIGRAGLTDTFLEMVTSGDSFKLSIAPESRVDISRNQLRVTLESDQARIVNLSKVGGEILLGSEVILPEEEKSSSLPFVLTVGTNELNFNSSYHTLAAPNRFYKDLSDINQLRSRDVLSSDTEHSTQLISILEQVTSVLQQSTNETQLFDAATKAIKHLISLDGVLIRKIDEPDFSQGDLNHEVDPQILSQLVNEKNVIWGKVDQTNLNDPEIFFVGAPIVTMERNEEHVTAILYGQREIQGNVIPEDFSEMQAQLVKLIACAMGASLARMANQKTAIQFEQFFTPTLANQLLDGSELLEAHESEITVLICDIRAFSSISEQLTPRNTSDWVQDVLSQLSEVVLKHEGVLVDYIGDELIAMWGAPVVQPRHAELACLCAADMVKRIPLISQKWKDEIKWETEVGIGINSGLAFVGNIGSTQKFKYGPLGDTVNRASRVQGLTKQFKVSTLITGATKSLLPEEIVVRRIGNARVVNIQESIELFELCDSSTERQQLFENALASLESGDVSTAAELLTGSIDFNDLDYPSLLLLSDVIKKVILGDIKEEYEWIFKSK